jgi:hypothetical protein
VKQNERYASGCISILMLLPRLPEPLLPSPHLSPILLSITLAREIDCVRNVRLLGFTNVVFVRPECAFAASNVAMTLSIMAADLLV